MAYVEYDLIFLAYIYTQQPKQVSDEECKHNGILKHKDMTPIECWKCGEIVSYNKLKSKW